MRTKCFCTPIYNICNVPLGCLHLCLLPVFFVVLSAKLLPEISLEMNHGCFLWLAFLCWFIELLKVNMPVSWFSLFLPDWLYWSGPYFFANTLNGHFFSYTNGWHDCREYREHVKDLSCVSKDFCRIVIVDNNPFSFILQPLNGIPCVPFSAGQHSDDQVTGDEHRSFSGSQLQLSKIILIFPCIKHFSSWRLYFHFWSIFLSRKMSDLYCTKGFICQNGSKSMGSPKLIRQFKFCCVLMELFW